MNTIVWSWPKTCLICLLILAQLGCTVVSNEGIFLGDQTQILVSSATNPPGPPCLETADGEDIVDDESPCGPGEPPEGEVETDSGTPSVSIYVSESRQSDKTLQSLLEAQQRREGASTVHNYFLMRTQDAATDERDSAAKDSESAKSAFDLIAAHTGNPGEIPTTRPLIVTLPDPVDSHLRREFDIFLDTLRLAFEEGIEQTTSEGTEIIPYSMDRFFLPWSLSTGGEQSSVHRHHPGILLFRKGTQSDYGEELLVVFLVGETPTWGVQSGALLQALRQAAELTERRPNVVELPIIGPTYSGSTSSLKRAIDSWWAETVNSRRAESPRHFKLQVISGTATADVNSAVMLGQGSPLSLQLTSEDPEMTAQLTYRSVATSDNKKNEVLNWYLEKHLDVKPKDIALLVETSAFGRSLGIDPEDTTTRSKQDSESADSKSLRIPFPMHLAQIQDTYAQINGQEQASGATNGTTTGGGYIPLDFSHGSKPKDVPLPFAAKLTSASADRVMSQILREIKLQNKKAVGIVATDVRDQLFLARLIRERLSDVFIFTYEADLLLTNPDYSRSCRGMLVASSFSLLRGAGPDSGPASSIFFPSDQAHGLFNAIRRSLGSNGLRSEGEMVQIATVGRDQFVTLARKTPGEVRRREPTEDEPGTPALTLAQHLKWQLRWGIGTCILSLLVLIVSSWLSLRADMRYRAATKEQISPFWRLLGRIFGDERVRQFESKLTSSQEQPASHRLVSRVFYMLLVWLIGSGFVLLACAPLILDDSDYYVWHAMIVVSASCLLLVLGFAKDVQASRFKRKTRAFSEHGPSRDDDDELPARDAAQKARLIRWTATIPVTILTGYFTYLLIAALRISAQDGISGPELAWRLVNLFSGVSPLLPISILAAGLAGALVVAIHRFQIQSSFSDDTRDRLAGKRVDRTEPTNAEEDGAPDEADESAKPSIIAPTFHTLVDTMGWFNVVSIVVLILGFFTPLLIAFSSSISVLSLGEFRILRGLGVAQIDTVASILFCLLVLTILIAWSRFLSGWLALKEFLERLSDREEKLFGSADRSATTETAVDVPEVTPIEARPAGNGSFFSGEDLEKWLRLFPEPGEPPSDSPDEIRKRHTRRVLRAFLRLLRWDLKFSVFASLLIVTAVLLFPFQPHRFLMAWTTSILILIGVTSLYVIPQMDGEHVLSQLFTASPDKVTLSKSLAGSVVSYSGLPLLTALIGQVSPLQDLLGSAVIKILGVL